MANEKIMIVEDEVVVAMEIEAHVRKLGYQVCAVLTSGEDAVASAEKNTPDLVLMDIMLGGKIDGIEAASPISHRSDIPVIYLTAYADDATLERAKKTEPYGYLLKPFEEIELRNVVEIAIYKHYTEKSLRESGTQAERALRENYDTQKVINELLRISLADVLLKDLLQSAIDLILSLDWLAFDSKGCIYLVEQETGTLVMKAWKNLDEKESKQCARVPFGKCICGRAAGSREIIFSENSKTDERHDILNHHLEAHGHYCIPIIHGETLLGVINIYVRGDHRSRDNEIQFLNAFAYALAGIIRRRQGEDERRSLIGELQGLVKKVSQSQKEWQETFDGITDLISIHDEEFRIIKANKAFAEHFGLHPRDVVNRKCGELFHPGGKQVMNCPHMKTMKENRPAQSEDTDSTGRIFNVSTFPYHSPDGKLIGSIHIARDITEQREQEMRLIMSERLASLGQMASGVAHEINNPLASILGCSEALLARIAKDKYDPGLFGHYLRIIGEEIQRCKEITTDMLSVVRKTSYERKEIKLNDLLSRTMEIISFQGRLRSVEVKKYFRNDLPVIRGSEGELRQLFLAIVLNALEAMEDKGTLTVETGSGNSSVFVKISDTGPGIPEEIIARIFDPFFTTKSEKGGTGLGLSIAHKIVANHKGTINVSPGKGKGATFSITLPVET